ncbi:MAG TPA: COX15/CtaA family protein [Gaiellaceae bacterium]|nr:COX15/CtaA family protein [Gaiellaceae bacterium]
MQVEAQASRVRGFELAPSTFRLLATASAVALYAIIVSGATVRLTGSGLGCEGWPGCTPGAVFPEKGYHSFVEFGNRVVSLFPILLSLGTAVASHFLRTLPRWVRTCAWVAALGTIAQAPLGLITVRLDLDPVAVMSHFLLAIVVLSTAVVVAVEARRTEVGPGERFVPDRLRWASLAFAALTLVVVFTGTLVTASGPHAGDPDVVDRLGNIETAIRVHVRVTAVFGIALLALVWYLRRVSPTPVRRIASVLLALVVAQAIVGETQWRNALPWWLVLVHVALAAGIWATTVWLVTLIWRPTASSVRT